MDSINHLKGNTSFCFIIEMEDQEFFSEDSSSHLMSNLQSLPKNQASCRPLDKYRDFYHCYLNESQLASPPHHLLPTTKDEKD